MKTRFISGLAFIAAIALGCSTKEDFNQHSKGFYDFEDGYRIEILQAILPEPFVVTKLIKDNDGNTTWQLTDQIAVCAYNPDTDKYKYVTGAPTLVPGQFIFKVEDPWEREAYAIYPAYWSDDRYCDNPVKVNLPEMYFCDEIESPTANVGMIAINSAMSNTLNFRQFCGSLRLTVTGVPAGTEELSIVFDKCITGSFEIKNPWTNSPYISVDDTATASEIRVIFDPPTTAEGSCEINIPMPGGNYGTIAGSAFDESQNEVASGNAVFAKTLDRTSFEFFTLDLSAVSSSPIGGVTTNPMPVVVVGGDGYNHIWN